MGPSSWELSETPKLGPRGAEETETIHPGRFGEPRLSTVPTESRLVAGAGP